MYDCIIIGGGQSGLATAYYLRRSGLNYLVLDAQEHPGGSWQQYWESLRLFSPAEASSLPGWLMPKGQQEYPSRDEVIDYLRQYEVRYKLPVARPVQVRNVYKTDSGFLVATDKKNYETKTIVSATGSFSTPYLPAYPGSDIFAGEQLHAAAYKNPAAYTGKKVLVVGGGNSGAQILAEVATVANTLWVTEKPPRFLPDAVDGRYLFSLASKIYEARKRGEDYAPKGSLGDIVMIPPVKAARERGDLQAREPFERFTSRGIVWKDGSTAAVDVVIWCTGYKPALQHLASLELVEQHGRVQTAGTQSKKIAGLWLVGYGSWTGYASATLIGVGRSARQTATEISEYLKK